jgi:S-methylmethionine-dependent homocysteine/selenocysteine methylase
MMSITEARDFHAAQIDTFADTAADMVSVFTMNYVEEAAGIAQAARAARMPLAVSFTLETDGRLPSGDTLGDAIARTDDASDGHPSYYMINCAHPSHFEHVLDARAPWLDRIRGLRANASRRSHAELDESTDLDDGNPEELGGQYRALRPLLRKLSVVGGCCGTDHRHVASVCAALTQPATIAA